MPPSSFISITFGGDMNEGGLFRNLAKTEVTENEVGLVNEVEVPDIALFPLTGAVEFDSGAHKVSIPQNYKK